MAEEEGKKKGRGKKFFLFALLASAIGAVVAVFRRRRSHGMEESEWQELPPPEGDS
ncbi:MAG: hypothetical protein ACRDH6_03645 [Actinomycetota bacterium]